jgi:coenzyme F420-reducing hydrogenase beta subunit
MDEKFQVRHLAVRSREELSSLNGYQPVQSEIGDTYRRVRHHLDQGRTVLFCGTPCQVDGLYYFLGEHPENLLTVDLLCHGVSSPGVWSHLIRSIAYVKKKQPAEVCFSARLGGARERRFRVRFTDDSVFDAPFSKCEFGRGHDRGLFLRPACHSCPYTSPDRPGDLSLGDYANLPKDFFPDEQKKGISLLLVNSAKGAHVFDPLPLKKELRTLADAVADHPALSRPRTAPEERASFFEAYAQQPFQQVRNRFLAPLAYQERRGRFRDLLSRLRKQS